MINPSLNRESDFLQVVSKCEEMYLNGTNYNQTNKEKKFVNWKRKHLEVKKQTIEKNDLFIDIFGSPSFLSEYELCQSFQERQKKYDIKYLTALEKQNKALIYRNSLLETKRENPIIINNVNENEENNIPKELKWLNNNIYHIPINKDNNVPGIYFLKYRDELVYIGQSKNVYNRIPQHIKSNIKEFDETYFVCVPKDKLNLVEKLLIMKYKPKYNIVHKDGEYYPRYDKIILKNIIYDTEITYHRSPGS